MKAKIDGKTYDILDARSETLFGLVKVTPTLWAFNDDVTLVLEPEDIKAGVNTEIKSDNKVEINTLHFKFIYDNERFKVRAEDESGNEYDACLTIETAEKMVENWSKL